MLGLNLQHLVRWRNFRLLQICQRYLGFRDGGSRTRLGGESVQLDLRPRCFLVDFSQNLRLILLAYLLICKNS